MECVDCYARPNCDSIIDVIRPDTGLTWHFGHSAEQIAAREPTAVRMSIHDFTVRKAMRQASPITWEPSTAERYAYMLGILPPAMWIAGYFLVGEPTDHCAATGAPRFQAYRKRGTHYYASSRPMTRVELRAIVS